ncbi:hypothetical protein PROFUN_12590 [Planoprotostelium fungivorum]|uniref:Uncharacterized protein n=1 Tax=Planoprotostelium fungivorum TaxID=1890364 RepID=A0A2P6N684_9EUKA|nr:hypothetical protein PROFUN_12590 [Planoprotostelium fungivorum]
MQPHIHQLTSTPNASSLTPVVWCIYCDSTHNAQIPETQTHIFIDCPAAKDIWNEQWKKTRTTLGLKHRLNIFQPTPDDKDPKYNPPWDPQYLGLVPKDVKTTPPPTTAESSEEFQTMGYLVLNSLRPKSGRAFLHKSGKL